MDKLPRKLRNVTKLQQELKKRPETYWNARGRKMALELFHQMAERVPAYKDFLKQHGIDHKTIRTTKDFKRVPTIDKDNYLRKYDRKDLCWDGKFSEKQWVISTTSGSTGEPFYFPRTNLQDEFYALTAELYLRENFQIQNKSTLYIDAFAMGAWIGGLFTYEAIKQVADKGYQLSIITPGINKTEVINSVRKLGKDFDQVIIGCYPPLLKDIIDLGVDEGLDWGKYNLGIIFSAEGFGEEFRNHIITSAQLKNHYASTLNHYGTVDLGTMSHETVLTNYVRQEAVKDRTIFHNLFKTSKQPTLTQYLPELFYFETQNSTLLCSSYSGLPLVRYDLKDNGGILSNRSVKSAFRKQNRDLDEELIKTGISDKTWNLPMVYLYERSDFSVTYLGAVIYPEEVRRALTKPDVAQFVSGKCTLEVTYTKDLNTKLIVHVELKNNIARNSAMNRRIQELVHTTLLEENSEYASSYKSTGTRAKPKIILWPFSHPLHFSGQGKHKWSKK